MTLREQHDSLINHIMATQYHYEIRGQISYYTLADQGHDAEEHAKIMLGAYRLGRYSNYPEGVKEFLKAQSKHMYRQLPLLFQPEPGDILVKLAKAPEGREYAEPQYEMETLTEATADLGLNWRKEPATQWVFVSPKRYADMCYHHFLQCVEWEDASLKAQGSVHEAIRVSLENKGIKTL